MLTGRRAVRTEARADGGVSLVEMIVTMFVLGLLLAVMLTVTISISRVANHDRAVADASTKARNALTRVGRVLPDASVVTTPGTAGTSTYVEALIPARPGTPSPTCVQWRVDTSTGRLQSRTWSTVNPIASAWLTLTDRVVNTAAQPPFTVRVPDTAFGTYRVVVDLYLSARLGATVEEQGAFALRNSASSSSGSAVCTEVART